MTDKGLIVQIESLWKNGRSRINEARWEIYFARQRKSPIEAKRDLILMRDALRRCISDMEEAQRLLRRLIGDLTASDNLRIKRAIVTAHSALTRAQDDSDEDELLHLKYLLDVVRGAMPEVEITKTDIETLKVVYLARYTIVFLWKQVLDAVDEVANPLA